MAQKKSNRQLWVSIFAFLFATFSLGIFLTAYAMTQNQILSLGYTLIAVSGLFSVLFAFYLLPL